MSKNIYIESLVALGGKKNKDAIDYVADQLVIRNKGTKIEYTVKKVRLGRDGKPVVVCYRYYGPDKNNKKTYMRIHPKDFDKYEPV